MCSVYVCVRIHTPTPTYTLTRVKNTEDTDNTPIFPCVKNNPPCHATSALIDKLNPPNLCSPTLNETNCTYMSAYEHPAASVYANVYADFHSTWLTCTPAHAWCSQHLSKMHAYSPQKMHVDSCMRAYATVRKFLCHRSYCELI